MKLIKCSDYVLQEDVVKDAIYRLRNYANFLKRPLELGMFIPCDKDGNVLSEPKRWADYLEYPDSFDGNNEWAELYEYQGAKERVLFEGLNKLAHDILIRQGYKTIEDLTELGLTLTKPIETI